MDKSKIEILIPTFNEEDNIDKVIKELNYEGYNNITLLDGNSTDNTVNIAKQYNCRIILDNPNIDGFGASIINGLNNYSVVKRRFEIKHNNKVMIIDDYAHHPIEVEETIRAAKNGWNKRIISVFQPHLFSRTKNFYKEFANALNKSDIVIITDIYPAREKPLTGVTSKLIIDEINDNKNTFYIPNKNDIPKKIFKVAKEDDIIIIMGAGNINTIINSISAGYGI